MSQSQLEDRIMRLAIQLAMMGQPVRMPEPIATVTIPVKTVSELNRHEHWRHRQQRAKGQHEVVAAAMFAMLTPTGRYQWSWSRMKHLFPVHVHITRLGSRKLDTDNLAGSQKHVRDAIAKFLGCDDGDESKVTWSYGQERQAKGYSVRVEFYRRTGT